MATRVQAIKLFAFLLLIAGVVVGLVALFVGAFWEERAHYYMRVPESVYGLEGGAEVNLQGVRIGRVSELGLAEANTAVLVSLEVDRDIRIPSDAQAILKFRGLTGLRVIDIVGGSVQAEALPEGSHIRYERSAADVLIESADEIAVHATRLFEHAGQVAARLSEFVGDLDPEEADALIENAGQLLSNLDRSALELHSLMRDTREPLSNIVANVSEATRHADTMLTSAVGALQGIDLLIGDLQSVVRDSDDDLRSTTHNLRQASQDLEELARRLRERPSRILFDRPPEERELP